MPRETLLDFFNDFAHLEDQFLLYDDGIRVRTYTYADVAGKARAFAKRLRASGIERDDKIIVYSENRPEWVFALWGAALAGVVLVPIDFRSSSEFVQKVQEIVTARAVLVGDEVIFDSAWKISSLDVSALNSITATSNDTLEIIFTSGATSEPKGVVISHRNVLANIVPVEGEVLKYRKYGKPFHPIRFLNLLPLSHMFGQAMATFIPPMLPGLVVFMRGFNPSEIVRQIRSRRISVLVSVPKILDVLREYVVQKFPELRETREEKSHWLIRWWKYRKVHRMLGWKFWAMIVGAAPLPGDLEAFWKRLGYVVIQGYGLTETAPIVTLNHPFHARQGSAGKPIAGVEVKIAPDGEILVRGENVTSGYYNAPAETARAFEDGWFHTGDIGQMDSEGQLTILGRKKEMIVTPEGLNVFPDDVERVLNAISGVRDSAVIGTDRVHAVLILEPGVSQDEVVQRANKQLADYQKIRTVSIWPYDIFPRTEGTGKLKRMEIAKGTPPPQHGPKLDLSVPLEQLTSLERVERMVALNIDESEMTGAPATPRAEFRFPTWNHGFWARALRRTFLPGFLLPLTRVFAWIRTQGRENLAGVTPPVIFASNHQSYMDVASILAALPARFRYRVAPAMRKEFFDAHFHPEHHTLWERFTNSLNYVLAALVFDAFPIPQREAGALETLQYMGEISSQGWCVLIFPEGKMTDAGEISEFQPGVGMMASRLDLPVVPIRIRGLDQVLHRTWKFARPNRVEIAFGEPLKLAGGDYVSNARKVEEAVRKL
ncbi:MAG TPA: AMP-binding protein [Bryobacteraceae bacterium]|nr:AMP-binding protein [Bryobacteraceae bacterium]